MTTLNKYDFLNDPTGTMTAGAEGDVSPTGWVSGARTVQGGLPTPKAGEWTTTDWLNWVTSRIVNSTATNAARQLTMVADRQEIPLIYGEDRVGGMVLNIVPWSDPKYVCVQILWGYACDSMTGEPTYNDEPLPEPLHSFYTGYGANSVWSSFATQFQAVSGVAYTDTLAGWCVSYILLPVNKFTGSLRFEAILKGRRVYDPRDNTQTAGNSATWKWSDNPSVCDADFLKNFCGKTVDYGTVGVSGDYSTATHAANANDALVSSEKRRTLNVTFRGRENAKAIAETLRAYAGVFHVFGANGIKLVPDRPGNSVATYTHSSGQIASVRVSKKDTGNFPTESEVVYTNRTVTPWKDDSVFVAVDGVSQGTIPRRLTTVRMPGLNRYSQARREAWERLNRMRTSDLSVTMDVFDIGIQHEEGDIITANHPLWNANKLFRVGDCEPLPNNLWRLSCAEYQTAGYSDDASVGPTYPDTGFTDPSVAPATPTGLARSFGASGIEFTWNANPELTVTQYELRKGGANWSAASPMIGSLPTIVGGTTFVWPAQTAGTYTIRLKAITNVGVYSTTEQTLSVTINAPTVTTPTYVLSNENAILTWSLASTDLPIKFYRVRKAGVLVAEVNSDRYTALVDWSGDKTFTVAAVDIGGNEGATQSVVINISGPSAVQNFHATVVVNTVLFYWTAPSIKPLPIVRYEMRKGSTWDTAASIGDKAGDQTFTSFFEGDSATNTYWIRAVDSAGIAGTPVSLSLKVDAPSGFKLQNEWNSNFSGANTNLSGAVLEFGNLYLPITTGQTFQQHFQAGPYASPQAQITAGYEIYIEPSAASGYYREWFDAGSTVSSSFITVNQTGVWVDGSDGSISVKIEVDTVSTFNSGNLQTFNGVTQAFAANFRYIRVTVTASSTGSNDLYKLTTVNVKLALQTSLDSGKKVAANFSGSPPTCAVSFTKSFIDVEAITVTPLGTSQFTPVVEFTDSPNPTGFTVRIYNASGTQVSNDFTWTATGVL